MDTNNPVTEAEMTGFFSRIATQVVGLSQQAEELQRIKDQLMKERDEALMKEMEAHDSRDKVSQALSDLTQRHGVVIDAVAKSESRVRELEEQVRKANAELSDWHAKYDTTASELEKIKDAFTRALNDGADQAHRANEAEQSLAEATGKLKDLQEHVANIFGLVSKAQAPADPTPSTGEQSSESSPASPTPKQAPEVPAPPADPLPEQSGSSDTTPSTTPEPAPSDSLVKAIPDPFASTVSGGPSPRPWWEVPVSDQKVG